VAEISAGWQHWQCCKYPCNLSMLYEVNCTISYWEILLCPQCFAWTLIFVLFLGEHNEVVHFEPYVDPHLSSRETQHGIKLNTIDLAPIIVSKWPRAILRFFAALVTPSSQATSVPRAHVCTVFN
jgi:hypothetical protein